MGLVFMIVSQGNLDLLGIVQHMLDIVEAQMEMPFPYLHLHMFGLTIALFPFALMALLT